MISSPRKLPCSRCHKGILELRFAEPDSTASFTNSASYKFEQATEKSVTSKETLMDPLDHRNVYIAESGIAGSGDGLFARRTINPGEIVALYAGTLVFDEGKLHTYNMTMEEMEDAQKNLLTYSNLYSLDIPPRYTNITAYRASLGHKVSLKYPCKEIKINNCRFTGESQV